MRPQKPKTTREGDLFRARLEQIINNLSDAALSRFQPTTKYSFEPIQ